ncbi:leucine-rich repeat domain-containing protein [Gilvimarinus japonicus]|uniref:Leucine-rich repeat domain-containing protein n=1 Tax=Gilvimarinus japonicus TaxID=1796469 RepID=A0ABV7HRX9_9GAMM
MHHPYSRHNGCHTYRHSMSNYAFIALIGLLGLLSGCESYDVSINDNVVYTPKPLLRDVNVADSNLASCIKQTISDDKITRAVDLTRLRCTHAGIVTLAGIETFYGLVQLDLGDNAITDVKPLEKLGRLQVALLGENHISSAEPLLRLIKLVELDLEGNPIADCRDVAQLERALKENQGMLLTPKSCEKHTS